MYQMQIWNNSSCVLRMMQREGLLHVFFKSCIFRKTSASVDGKQG